MTQYYELSLLNWFRWAIGKNLKTIEYVYDNYTPLLQLSKSLSYPSVIIKRNIENGNMSTKSIDIETERGIAKFFVLTQQYGAYVFVQTEVEALQMLYHLKFFCEQHPYNLVDFEGCCYPIGMRFQYINVSTEEDGDAKKGARRAVGIVWQSSIPYCAQFNHYALIKTVKINVHGNITAYGDNGDEQEIFSVVRDAPPSKEEINKMLNKV